MVYENTIELGPMKCKSTRSFSIDNLNMLWVHYFILCAVIILWNWFLYIFTLLFFNFSMVLRSRVFKVSRFLHLSSFDLQFFIPHLCISFIVRFFCSLAIFLCFRWDHHSLQFKQILGWLVVLLFYRLIIVWVFLHAIVYLFLLL